MHFKSLHFHGDLRAGHGTEATSPAKALPCSHWSVWWVLGM